MPIIITDSDNVSTVHTAERLQINLAEAQEDVEKMFIEIYFTITTKLPNGRVVGYPYWDNQALVINCKGNPKLTEAMKTIQEAIGVGRYKQLTEPPLPDFPTQQE